LQEEEDSSSNDPFDTYVLGSNNGSIVTKDTVVGSENDIVAEIDDVITVSLVGTIIQNKKEFLNNEMYTFKLGGGNTFPGFNDGLIGCKVGTKRLIKVPPNKAYGKKGAKGIPPMSDLLFDVEVKGVARGPVERIIATIGTDRLLPSLGLIALLAISPFLPS
jgi:FKBP-type peptidyl-prolyl cis-trans isomerase